MRRLSNRRQIQGVQWVRSRRPALEVSPSGRGSSLQGCVNRIRWLSLFKVAENWTRKRFQSLLLIPHPLLRLNLRQLLFLPPPVRHPTRRDGRSPRGWRGVDPL